MAASNVSMKLLINTENNTVLFAEAGKDFVDFLFNIMSLPIATVIMLVGCLANLHKSIENLNETYIQSDKNKNTLLKPSAPSVPLFLLQGGSQSTGKVFKCAGENSSSDYGYDSDGSYYSNGSGHSCNSYYSDDTSATCRNCNKRMTCEMTYVSPPGVVTKPSGEGGFVMGVVTYMIMDDLVVKPMSTISSLTLINQFKVKDIGSLKEKQVKITMKEAVMLLKASLNSKKVLTDVFLGNI